jgi:hypothetical protein
MIRHRVSRPWAAAVAGLALAGTGVPAAGPKTAEKAARPPVIVAPLAADVVAEAVRAEQDAVLRRLDVCDRLRKLGETTGDTTLVLQADELEKQATALYAARVARLGVKGGPKATDDEPTVGGPAVVPAAPVATGGTK